MSDNIVCPNMVSPRVLVTFSLLMFGFWSLFILMIQGKIIRKILVSTFENEGIY